MRLRCNQYCPIHKSLSCCGRELLPNKPRLIRLGVQKIEDPHHPRGYRASVIGRRLDLTPRLHDRKHGPTISRLGDYLQSSGGPSSLLGSCNCVPDLALHFSHVTAIQTHVDRGVMGYCIRLDEQDAKGLTRIVNFG